MSAGSIMAFAALGVAVLAFIGVQLSSSRAAHLTKVQRLEELVENQKIEITALKVRVNSLQDENLHLMRKIFGLENGGTT